MGRCKAAPLFQEGLMANIIIPRGDKFGKTRSEQEENLRKEWGSTMNDSQLDKLKFIEKKVKEKTGSTKNFFPGHHIDEIK